MNKQIVSWIVGVGLLAAANAAPAKDIKIYQQTDDFAGTTLYYTAKENPKLEGGSFLSSRYLLINFNAGSPVADPASEYFINIFAMLPDWMFISSGESLVLKVDGKIVKLKGSGSGSARNVDAGGDVTEDAVYSMPLATLKELAAAKTIEFRLYGDKADITGVFTPVMMEELKFFAEQAPALVKDPSAPGAPIAPSPPAAGPAIK